MSSDLIIGMAGSGGDGIVSAGDAFMSAAGSQGYHALLTKPLLKLVSELNAIDPRRPGYQRLPIPPGHADNELGLLVNRMKAQKAARANSSSDD